MFLDALLFFVAFEIAAGLYANSMALVAGLRDHRVGCGRGEAASWA